MARTAPSARSPWSRVFRRSSRHGIFALIISSLVAAGSINPGLAGEINALAQLPGIMVEQSAATNAEDPNYPPVGLEEAKAPLGKPAPLAASSESYSFVEDDTKAHFAAYDPCRPIHYVTRPDHAPPGGRKLITEAVAAASKASGLVFIDDGDTTEGYTAHRNWYQPERYGKVWAPVLLVWATLAEQPEFSNHESPDVTDIVGLGGSQAVELKGEGTVFVTGDIQLNAPVLGELMGEPGGPQAVRGVIEHELGHVLGLGHVDDPHQLMYEETVDGLTDYAPGDLTGLARLGRGKCFPDL